MTAIVNGEPRVDRKVSVGEVITGAIAVGKRNIRPLVVLALLWIALPEAVFGLAANVAGDLGRAGTTVSTILGVIFSGAAAHLVIRDLQGQPVDLRAAHKVGTKLFLPLLGMTILSALGVGLGVLLLIVPGIILALMWSVALPARVAEGPGVMAAFHRSRTLTKGNRWPIFLVLLISVLPLVVITAVFAAVFTLLGEESLVANMVISPLMSAGLSIIWGVIPPTLYMHLSGVTAPDVTAAIFD